MEAVNYLTDWIKWLLLIVPVGAGFTIGYFAACKAFTDDYGAIADLNRKIVFTLKAAVIMETVSGLVTIIKKFYT